MTDATPERRGPGRPKGLPKTGGRTKGTPNRLSMDQRQRIAKLADPVELLCQIVRGRGRRVRNMMITPEMQTACALKLAAMIVPPPKPTDASANAGRHEDALDELEREAAEASGLPAEVETARRMAFLLARGVASQPVALPPSTEVKPEPEPEPAPEPVAPPPEPVAAVPRSIRRPEPPPRGEVDMHDADMHGSHNGHAVPYNPHNWN